MCKQCSEGICSVPPINRQVSSHFLKARASALVRVTWEIKHQTTNVTRFPTLFLELLLMSMTSCYVVSSGPFGRLWSAVLAVLPPNFLRTPSLLAGGGRVGKRESLDGLQALFTKPLVCYQQVLVKNPKHSTIQAEMEKINSISSECKFW